MILDSSNRSPTIAGQPGGLAADPLARSRRPRAARTTTPSASASAIARIPASGLRRSWLIHATSSRRDASAARSRSRASRSHTLRRAMARPSTIAAGTVTSATSRQTSSIVVSVGVEHEPADAEHPDQRREHRDQHQHGQRGGQRPLAQPVQHQRRPAPPPAPRTAARTAGCARACVSIAPKDSPESITAAPGRSGSRRPTPWRPGTGFAGLRLDLLPQPSHVDGHGGLIAEVPAPHLLQQVRPGESGAGMGEEERQQIELAGGQRQFAAAERGLRARSVCSRRSPSRSSTGGRVRPRQPRAAQHRRHPQRQFAAG